MPRLSYHFFRSLIVIPFFLVTLFILFYLWYLQTTAPLEPSFSGESTLFTIPPGQSVDAIAKNLKAKKLIRSVAAFKLVVLKSNFSQRLQAGNFSLTPAMSVNDIVNALTHGTNDIQVTLIEGWRHEEIASRLMVAYQDFGYSFPQEDFNKLVKNDEGYLFPDTYRFPLPPSVEQTRQILINNFNQKVTPQIKQAALQNTGLSFDQVLILASLVEREARQETDRPLVAGIILRRLQNDWPLQVDATVQYALGNGNNWWPSQLTPADLQINSPYNTYLHPGLPPTPICNPSLSAIKAASYPQISDYWFYLTDLNGKMHYAKTIEEHNQHINQYLRQN